MVQVAFLFGSSALLSAEIPSSRDIIARIKKTHPRLLIDGAGFAALGKRVETEAEFHHLDSELRRAAEKVIGMPLPKHELPDGVRLLDTSRRTVERTLVLAMMARLHGEERYRDRLWEEYEAVAAFKDFNPSHFLDTAEMTFALAIGYDWLYDQWKSDQRAAIRKAIVELGLKPGLKVYRSGKGWPKSDFNWNQVCNGGMAVGALAVADEEPALCGEILHDALASVPLAIASYAPDGAWGEGPAYWSYATTYTVRMIAALESATGSDYGLSRSPGFEETALFPIYMTGPGGRWFNFSDCSEKAAASPCMFWLASRFHLPVAAWYADRYSKPSLGKATSERLLWEAQPGLDPATAKLPLDKYFRRYDVITMRSSWSDPHALFVGMQARSLPANHEHLDLGSFVLDGDGERWAIDLGADNYNLPGYFSRKRYDYYRLRAEGHNALVIAPDNNPDQNPKAHCEIEKFVSEPKRAFAVAELSDGYISTADQVKRGLALVDRRHVLVQDEITKPRGDVWWFMHTRASATLSPDQRTATLEQNGRKLSVRLLLPKGAEFTVAAAVPLPTSPHPEKQGVNQGVCKLAIHVARAKALRIAVLFLPANEQSTVEETKIVPLEKW
jgi:hypothetical protein